MLEYISMLNLTHYIVFSNLIQTSFNIFCFNIKQKALLLCTVWEIDDQ